MSEQPAQRKPSVLKWIGLAFLLLFGWFLWSLLGPNPPIVVSKQTTYITAPLAADGLPDYEAYLLEEMRKNKPRPEDNAAVAMWQVMGPGGMDPADWKLLEAELRSLTPPEGVKRLSEPLFAYDSELGELIRKWLSANEATADTDFNSDYVETLYRRPWTSQECPPADEWFARYQPSIELLHKGAARKSFYSPSISHLNSIPEGLLNTLLYETQVAREVGSLHLAQTMHFVAEKDFARAIAEVECLVNWANHLNAEDFIVQKLVGMQIGGYARHGVVAICSSSELSLTQAIKLEEIFRRLRPSAAMRDGISRTERLSLIDFLAAKYRELPVENDEANPTELIDGYMPRIDPNFSLRSVNDWFDRLDIAMQTSGWGARKSAIKRFLDELDALQPTVSSRLATNRYYLQTLYERSTFIGELNVNCLFTAIESAFTAEDRYRFQRQVTLVAARLAKYRAEHSEYPADLKAAFTEEESTILRDLFHSHPLIYRKLDNGFLIYSRGENGINESGNCELGPWGVANFESQELFDDFDPRHEQIPDGADDISLRIPVEYPPWPWEVAAEDESSDDKSSPD